jgi:hypothetical protein
MTEQDTFTLWRTVNDWLNTEPGQLFSKVRNEWLEIYLREWLEIYSRRFPKEIAEKELDCISVFVFDVTLRAIDSERAWTVMDYCDAMDKALKDDQDRHARALRVIRKLHSHPLN